MKNYSLEQLKEIGAKKAASLKVTKLIASSDGQFFTPQNESYAKMHKRNKKGVELYELTYDETEAKAEDPKESEKPAVKKTAPDKIADIAKLETIADVENYIVNEKAKTVLAAAEARKSEIKAAEAAADAYNGRN